MSRQIITGCYFVLPLMWSVNLLGQYTQGSGVGFSNTLHLQTEWYSSSGITQRRVPFSWSLSGNPTVRWLGQSLPFSFLLSNYQSSFTQPFNFFGISPSYRWARVHLGYRNLNFSPFTLGNHRMLGAGIELTPGKWHFSFAYGRFRKAIERDSSFQGLVPGVFQHIASFSRFGFATKIGYGNPDSAYVAFSYLSGNDRDQSLDNAFMRFGIRPAQNAVLGMSTSFRMAKKLFWKTELAVSAYTRDSNADTVDIGDNTLLEALNNLFEIKESSQGFVAAETSLAWQGKIFGFKASYRRIDPDFKSMGTYYLQTDMEQIRMGPSIRFAKGIIQGTVGWQRDNLKKLKGRTSDRFIGNALFDYQFSPGFGLSFQYANFGFTQSPLTRNIVDTTLLEQINQSISVMPRWTIAGQKIVHTSQMVFSYNELADRRTQIFVPTDISSLQVSLTHGLNFIVSGLGLTFNAFYHNNQTNLFESATLGAGTGIQVPLFQSKASLVANGTYFHNDYLEAGTSQTMQASLQVSFPLSPKHGINLGLNWLQNKSIDQSIIPSFTEWRFRSGYSYTFSNKSKK